MEVAKHHNETTETFQYVDTPVHVLLWRHKSLHTLTLTQTQKKIHNVGQKFLTLIFNPRIAAKEGYSRV